MCQDKKATVNQSFITFVLQNPENKEKPAPWCFTGGRFPVDQRERGGGVSLGGRQTDEWKKREQLRISNEEMLKSIFF